MISPYKSLNKDSQNSGIFLKLQVSLRAKPGSYSQQISLNTSFIFPISLIFTSESGGSLATPPRGYASECF